jgi:transposase
MEEALESQIRHLYDVEGLSMRQIARTLQIGRKKVARILRAKGAARPPSRSQMAPYERLIREWYATYPSLQATQVFERLHAYGFTGSYSLVKVYTRPFRKKKPRRYHELTFLPGEEAQVDWAIWTTPFGRVYGFVFLLAYSRYVHVALYPRCSMEFFLDGHIRAYEEIQGVARTNRYDNLKSVVIKRKPEVVFNAQFLDFARHYRVSIYPCTPRRPNEKGRVERVIRDMNAFLKATPFQDLPEMCTKVDRWRRERNRRVHRVTGKAPEEALREEHLLPLPRIPYQPYRVVTATITTTGLVSFDGNRYSVPSEYSGRSGEIMAYPDVLTIKVQGNTVATHARVFDKQRTIDHPSHKAKLLEATPNYKYPRIYQVMKGLDPVVAYFLSRAESEGQDPLAVAYALFTLLKGISKETLFSALREAKEMGVHKVKFIRSLLHAEGRSPVHPVHPRDETLLEIAYEGRDLKDYDDLI